MHILFHAWRRAQTLNLPCALNRVTRRHVARNPSKRKKFLPKRTPWPIIFSIKFFSLFQCSVNITIENYVRKFMSGIAFVVISRKSKVCVVEIVHPWTYWNQSFVPYLTPKLSFLLMWIAQRMDEIYMGWEVQMQGFNPYTSKISLVSLLTMCHAIH